jgi:predicted transcriptional regulator of viral defense system
MEPEPASLQGRAILLLRQQGMVRLSEFVAAGITASTISRMEKRGEVVRLGRGLYQLPDASIDANHELALAARMVPGGVICLVSALAFHELTDTIPSRVWVAIGSKDRKPTVVWPALQIVRFAAGTLHVGVESHIIDGVDVPITNPVKTLVDLFRYRARAGRRYQKSPGLNLALEGLREALRQRKATPSEIARTAEAAGVWKVIRPYLEAMTAHA